MAIDTSEKRERALLVGADFGTSAWSQESSLDELERLADTAGAVSVARLSQKMKSPNPKTFIGKGKTEEICELVQAENIDIVIFDDELSPTQQSNLEKAVGNKVKIIDRTGLILDIFALRATTKEGRLQVKLAQNQYLYPRLRGMWAHLASNRMGGGVGSRFGEGESQLEVDRRMVRHRIVNIRKELEKLNRIRETQRERRLKSSVFKIALAGYTNAGKSTLLNSLCASQVLADDLLFATLDSTTRKLTLPDGRLATFTDTVGFIQKLPTTLVEAFKSTLDEIVNADLIMHLVDASSELRDLQINTVEDTLSQLNAHDIARLLVFNKCDLLTDESRNSLSFRYPHALFVSAQTGEGLKTLLRRIELCAAAKDPIMHILIPYSRGDLLNTAFEKCHVLHLEHLEAGTYLELRIPDYLIARFSDYLATIDV